jgi:glutamine cyclotransferase
MMVAWLAPMRRRCHTILAMLGLLTVACGPGIGAPPDGGEVDGGADGSPDAPPPDAPPPDAPPLDCDAIPQPPFTYRHLDEVRPVEDFAFDGEGHMLWSDRVHLFKSTYEQETAIFVTNMNAREGIRMLSTGDVMIADYDNDSLVRVDVDGIPHTVMNNLSFPDGIEIGLDDMVYLTILGEDRLVRVDPFSGEFTTLSEGAIAAIDGIAFNEDFTALYLAGVAGDATIYRLPIDAEGEPGVLAPWGSLNAHGSGFLDGLSVDACGNVYAADLYASKIFRIAPDGETVQTILDRSGNKSYMTVAQWGSGVGGWDPLKVYIPDVDVGTIELDLGVPGKPRPAP